MTSVTPNTGPVTGGTSVTITGTGLSGATSVTFGGVAATVATVVNANTITATTPAHSAGAVDVVVTTSGGTGTGANLFTYGSAPTVTAVAPATGPATGGTSIVITGTNFSGASAVVFGGSAAAAFTVNSATQITATSPAGTGTVDVRVTTTGGTSATSSADRFSYVAGPTVTGATPNSGPTSGGTSVTITGTNFTGATAVTFGGSPASNVTIVNPTTITATAPAHAAGTFDIAVTTPSGTGGGTGLYSYVAGPTVTAVAPASGPASGGTNVTITGSNFTGATAVTFGGTAAASFAVTSANSIMATTPPHAAGAVTVVVTTPSGAGTNQYTYVTTATVTALVSSRNPSEVGQAVTFTATVTANGATPSGTVTFNDGGTAIGTAAISSGVASLTTSALQLGSHSITAVYAGNSVFAASTSPALLQAVNTPQDSLKLRQLQIIGTKVAAQTSGAAISGAIDAAISEGFSGGGGLITPSGTGMRLNFSADESNADVKPEAYDPTKPGAAHGGRAAPYAAGNSSSRFDDAFAALDRNAATKAARKAIPAYAAAKEWMLWAEVKGSIVGKFDNPNGASPLYGNQVNGLLGLSRKVSPDLLVGAVAGYETFDYRSDTLTGRLTGDGWTAGAYLGWRFGGGLKFDAGATYSGIGYNGSAGTAVGAFDGRRVLVTGGLSGTRDVYGVLLEPSLRTFALWEHENAYVDSLGTRQGDRDFFTGRASAGVKAMLPWQYSATIKLAPYAGVFADYYINGDNAEAVALAGAVPLASVALLDGWSARVTAGIAAQLGGGATIAVGAELGGLGGNTQIWTFRGQASVPF